MKLLNVKHVLQNQDMQKLENSEGLPAGAV